MSPLIQMHTTAQLHDWTGHLNCTGNNECLYTELVTMTCIDYRIAGNIGGDLNLADWRLGTKPPN